MRRTSYENDAPWKYDGKERVTTANGRFTFLLTTPGKGAPEAEWRAHGELIAAAPEMLAEHEADVITLTSLLGSPLNERTRRLVTQMIERKRTLIGKVHA